MAALRGAVALVVGASSGIGAAIAARLAAEGAQLVAVGRSRERLDALQRQLAEPCELVCADVLDPAAVLALSARAPTPDIVVNSAGRFALGEVGRMPLADVDDVLLTNMVGAYRVFHAFVPRLRARGSGHIVSIGSVADRQVFPENGAYAASKFGTRALHEVLREELRGTGVRATLVSPAAVDTPAWDPIAPETRPGFPARSAMLRPDDVAAAVLFAVTQPPHVNVDELRLSRT